MKANFAIPGEANFTLGGFFSAPKSRAESEQFRQYFRQLREETVRARYISQPSLIGTTIMRHPCVRVILSTRVPRLRFTF